jgi:hypothetical protein
MSEAPSETMVAERWRGTTLMELVLARARSVGVAIGQTRVTYIFDRPMNFEQGDRLEFREVCPADAEWIGLQTPEAPRVPEVA